MFTTVRDRKSSAFDLYCHGNGRDELDVLDGTSPIYGPIITVFIVTVKILLIEHARVSRATVFNL